MLHTSLSLPLLVVYSLFVSAVLIWMNRRGVGPVGAAAGTLAVCVAVAVIQFFALGPATLSRQALQHWLLFVVVPGAVVFAASRFSAPLSGRGPRAYGVLVASRYPLGDELDISLSVATMRRSRRYSRCRRSGSACSRRRLVGS